MGCHLEVFKTACSHLAFSFTPLLDQAKCGAWSLFSGFLNPAGKKKCSKATSVPYSWPLCHQLCVLTRTRAGRRLLTLELAFVLLFFFNHEKAQRSLGLLPSLTVAHKVTERPVPDFHELLAFCSQSLISRTSAESLMVPDPFVSFCTHEQWKTARLLLVCLSVSTVQVVACKQACPSFLSLSFHIRTHTYIHIYIYTHINMMMVKEVM